MKARHDAEKLQPFFSANVMYVDVFEESIIGERSVPQFLKDVLGFGLSLPAVMREQVSNEDQIDIQLSLKLPLQDELEMRLSIDGKTVWGDKRGIPMRMIVSSRRILSPELKDISAVFEASHLAIRHTFVGLTERIHSKMGPIGEEL